MVLGTKGAAVTVSVLFSAGDGSGEPGPEEIGADCVAASAAVPSRATCTPKLGERPPAAGQQAVGSSRRHVSRETLHQALCWLCSGRLGRVRVQRQACPKASPKKRT